MTNHSLASSLAELTDVQRRAVEWEDGPLLVLAGPGSGKTRVLTCRVARLLDASRNQRFRILALTFTNKAAHVMASRITTLASGLEGRATIDTFHGFCVQVLRQHGVHLGIKPDFAIYAQPVDRQAMLGDALRRNGGRDAEETSPRLLPWIDHLKARLVETEQAERYLADLNGGAAEVAGSVARAYRLYEDEMRRVNALDFNSLILETYRLFAYPALARQYQTSYRYWLVDEFQDTNGAQYELLRRMAGGNFREVFAVADDDQTIFEWNGANVRRIGDLVRHFDCKVIQLPTNFRCPAPIVDAGNRLVVYNRIRARKKQPATAADDRPAREGAQIRCVEFASDQEEIIGVAEDIASLTAEARSAVAVLSRNRAPLQEMYEILQTRGVSANLDLRRDDFVSPEMRWLVACLRQVHRPLDRRNMAVLARAFDSFNGAEVDWGSIIARSESEGITWLSAWIACVRDAETSGAGHALMDPIAELAAGAVSPADATKNVLAYFKSHDPDEDLKEDLSAWSRISREIREVRGRLSLDRFLQELHLRTKEPAPPPGAPVLVTIHRAKGREFDTVYLIGMAEEILPSWRSLRSDTQIEEERRECFVAITRAKRRLVLSRARSYRGWPKAPSRFLEEMGCLDVQQAGDTAQHVGRRP